MSQTIIMGTIIMIIPIDNQYRISGDKHSWNIQEARTRTINGKVIEEWESTKFHPSITSAVNSLSNLLIRTSKANTVAEAIEEVKLVVYKLTQALDPNFEVINKNNEDELDEIIGFKRRKS
jgi:hypothetical protein